MAIEMPVPVVDARAGLRARKVYAEVDPDFAEPESVTPTTTGGESDSDSSEEEPSAPELGPGLYHDDIQTEDLTPSMPSQPVSTASAPSSSSAACPEPTTFSQEETLFVFDWDDTILPSTWIRSQGLRLDDGTTIDEWQREQLAEVAPLVIQTLQAAKLCGTVVLVTSAERGWIELSCRKFLPTVMPILENVRMVSARTTYEGALAPAPLDWKMRAFEVELARFYGPDGLQDRLMRKNVLSLGDGAHEREAVLRTTASAENCRAKSLKFVERPDVLQIIKQHELVLGCFDTIVNHDGDYDLCINC